ncbi:hypothetical protein, partial [Cereibacter azotoformans]|uniref:hypothetical protein n=1 Tax=Cereibacter azotoformans TaxID=43057 RepID=UPI00196134BC
VGRYASGPPSKRPNRPHIPSSSSMSKSTEDKNKRSRQITSDHTSHISKIFETSTQRRRLSIPSPSPFRFGEALSREPQKNPQEEKCGKPDIFPSGPKHTQMLCGIESKYYIM